jgi:cytochrome P450
MLSGGLDTTSALLSNTVHYLAEHPDVRAHLRGHPDRIRTSTEEFLRVFSPVQALARNVTADTVLRGTTLPAGSRVLVSWASANFDDREFAEPEKVLLDRYPNRHQAFGLGQHRCVGSHLARMEFAVALDTLLRRLGDYVETEGGAVPFDTVGTNNGWISIELEFTPGPRVHPR